MSKIKLKKELQKLSKEQLIELILELYDTYKPVKEFHTFYLEPKENVAVEKYKKKIIDEFYPNTKSSNPKLRFSEAKKAIAEFKALKPSAVLVAELMMTLAENACKFTYDFGDMTEQYYNSAATNYTQAIKFMAAEGLLPNFELRAKKCVHYASNCGYNFSDEIAEIYYQYYEK